MPVTHSQCSVVICKGIRPLPNSSLSQQESSTLPATSQFNSSLRKPSPSTHKFTFQTFQNSNKKKKNRIQIDIDTVWNLFQSKPIDNYWWKYKSNLLSERRRVLVNVSDIGPSDKQLKSRGYMERHFAPRILWDRKVSVAQAQTRPWHQVTRFHNFRAFFFLPPSFSLCLSLSLFMSVSLFVCLSLLLFFFFFFLFH